MIWGLWGSDSVVHRATFGPRASVCPPFFSRWCHGGFRRQIGDVRSCLWEVYLSVLWPGQSFVQGQRGQRGRTECCKPWKWQVSAGAGSQLQGDPAKDTGWTESGLLLHRTLSTDPQKQTSEGCKERREDIFKNVTGKYVRTHREDRVTDEKGLYVGMKKTNMFLPSSKTVTSNHLWWKQKINISVNQNERTCYYRLAFRSFCIIQQITGQTRSAPISWATVENCIEHPLHLSMTLHHQRCAACL